MINVVVYFLLGLLLLKCFYNLTIPYTLLGRMSRDEKAGISFMPYIEISLSVLIIALSFFVGEEAIISGTKNISLCVLVMVGGSYLNLFLVMMIGGWFVSK